MYAEAKLPILNDLFGNKTNKIHQAAPTSAVTQGEPERRSLVMYPSNGKRLEESFEVQTAISIHVA